jgi:hypothetical protein
MGALSVCVCHSRKVAVVDSAEYPRRSHLFSKEEEEWTAVMRLSRVLPDSSVCL